MCMAMHHLHIDVKIAIYLLILAKNFHLCGWKIEQCNRLKIKILYTI